MQLAQATLKKRLLDDDVFDNSTLLNRFLIRYKPTEQHADWTSAVTEEVLEASFDELAFTAATFDPNDRRWRSVLRNGYGLVTACILAVLLL